MAKSDAREREKEISLSEVGGPTADIFNINAVELAAAQRRVQQLERAIALETQRRHEEELRALLEGLLPLLCYVFASCCHGFHSVCIVLTFHAHLRAETEVQP